MIFWLVLAALVAAYAGRWLLARRARAAFLTGEHVTLAVRLRPGKRGFGWKHGYARSNGTHLEWRAEFKVGPGADMTFDLNDLRLRDHRPVRKGEAMLSDLCELVSVLYRGEDVEFGIPRTELDTLLGWVRT